VATLVCYGTWLTAARRAATGAFARAKVWSDFWAASFIWAPQLRPATGAKELGG